MNANGSISVLLVEDHQMFAQALAGALESEGDIEVTGIAATRADAITALQTEQLPRVVLMDYRLPDGNGAEAARQILSEHPGVRVVMLTASVDDNVLAEAISAGCSGYVSKSESIDHLAMAVRAAAAGQLSISPSMVAGLMGRIRGDVPQHLGFDLSTREQEVLRLLAEGLTNRAIGEQLCISTNTVRNHVSNILDKLQVHSKLEAVAVALREGLIKAPQ